MPRDKLYQLIHALTTVEKKFFQQYARRHVTETDTIYLQLFNAISKQASYDESKLKKQLPLASYNLHFHKAKAYLYSLILKSLVIRKSNSSAYSQVLELLCSIEILCEKQFFEQALELLEEVKELCRAHEFQELALAAIRWEESIAATSHLMTAGADLKMADNYSKRKDLLDEITLTVEYRYLFFKWSLINAPFTPPSTDAIERLAIFFKDPLLDPENLPKSKAPKRFHMGLNAMKARLEANHAKAFELSIGIVKIMESYPRGFYYTEMLLIYAYYSVIMDAVSAGKFSAAEKYLAKLKKLHPENPQLSYNHFHLLLASELTVLKAMERKRECLTLIDTFEKSIHRFKPGISRFHEYRNYLLIMNWLVKVKEYERAIIFINLMMQEKVADQRVLPFQYHARLLMLVVHYELKNLELLEYLVRQVDYYFSKHPLPLHFPGILLLYFKNILKPKSNLQAEQEELTRKLEEVRKNPNEKNGFKGFLDCGWLQNRGILK